MSGSSRQILPLSQKENLYPHVLNLIEKSFAYSSPFSFAEDFALLINKENHKNCYLLIDENDKVLGHIGVLKKELIYKNYTIPVSMLGGISIDEKERGKGNFSILMKEVLSKNIDDSALLFLWSDKTELYNKFGFYLCGENYSLTNERKNNPYEQTFLKDLNEQDLLQLTRLYEQYYRDVIHFKRDQKFWNELKLITSAYLFIKRDESLKITGYFFQGKGQDLTNIIYEYAGFTKNELAHYGDVWSPTGNDNEILNHLGFIKIGNPFLFKKMVSDIWGIDLEIKDNSIILGDDHMSFEDFLPILFGPFSKTISLKKPLYISGLESI
jgi:hypothetical protein